MRNTELASKQEKLLGTEVEIQLPKEQSSFFPICFSEIRRIEAAYSRFLPDSELTRLNANLGKWQEASDEMVSLLIRAEEFRRISRGGFDVALKEELEALGYDRNYSFVPKKKKGLGSSRLAGMLLGNVQIDPAGKRVLLRKQIDFGGMGKGYALDRVAAILDAGGAGHYCINAGGDVFARRGKGCESWQILLEHPDDPERAIGKIALDNMALAGSAPNRRKWGEGLHHLLDPKTGMPARGVKAVFSLAKSGIEADAYAKAIFAEGFGRGIALLPFLPIEALVVSSENKMHCSPGFKAEFFN